MRKDRHKKVRFKKRFFIIIIVIAAVVFAFGRFGLPMIKGGSTAEQQASNKVNISVSCAGDLVMHGPVLDAAKTKNGYDFTQSFRYLDPYIKDADMSFCSLEAPLVKSGYTGYPVFRSPDDLAYDLKDVGFDTVLTSSNHTNDAGERGIFRTIRVLKKAGLKVAGSRAKADDPRYSITSVNGVKVAIVSYVYGGGNADNRDLNGNKMTAKARECVNSFGYNTFNKDIKQIKATVKAARKAGAGVVIMYYHWGNEYQTHSSAAQEKIARQTVKDTDVDVIVGSHPHVPQEKTVIAKKNSEGKTVKKVTVYYAMGNLLSNQRREWMDGDVHTEEGYIVRLNIKYDKGKKKLVSLKSTTMPYWVDMAGSGPKKYTVIPLDKNYKNNKELSNSGNLGRATQAKKNINKILGSD